MTEAIYQNIVRSVDQDAPESVHLCSYPAVDESRVDKELEANMENVLQIVVLGRACRNAANIKNRQPIGKLFVGGLSDLPEMYADVVKGELNVKEVELGAATEEYITYLVKPQMRTLGPRYGKLLGGIRNHLMNGRWHEDRRGREERRNLCFLAGWPGDRPQGRRSSHRTQAERGICRGDGRRPGCNFGY